MGARSGRGGVFTAGISYDPVRPTRSDKLCIGRSRNFVSVAKGRYFFTDRVSSLLARQLAASRRIRQLIGPIVVVVRGVAARPLPLHFMA